MHSKKKNTHKTYKRAALSKKTYKGAALSKKTYKGAALETADKIQDTTRKPTCTTSQNCLLFGHQIEKVLEYFDFFKLDTPHNGVTLSWSLLTSTEQSDVYKVRFSKSNFNAYAVLKSSKQSYSDNLMYEYNVGKYINELCSVFPSFVYTYGIYYKLFGSTRPTSKQPTPFPDLKSEDIVFDEQIVYGTTSKTKNPYNICIPSRRMYLLTQYLDGSKPFSYYMRWGWPVINLQNMLAIMYQIYYALDCLQHDFSHNDLHQNNVLIYKLPTPIEFQYEEESFFEDKPYFSFKTKYLVKFIDYGRCTFPNDKSVLEPSHKCPDNGLRTIRNVVLEDIQLGQTSHKKVDWQLMLAFMVKYYASDLPTFFEKRGELYHIEQGIEMRHFVFFCKEKMVPTPTTELFGKLTIRGHTRGEMVFVPNEANF